MKLFFSALALFALLPNLHALGFANGIKIGELTPNSVTIWVRTTAGEEAQNQSNEWKKSAPNWTVEGAPALVRFSIKKKGGPLEMPSFSGGGWTLKKNNHCLQETLTLSPNTEYEIGILATNKEKAAGYSFNLKTPPQWEFVGKLENFPLPSGTPVTFTISTCQEFELRDDLAKGHKIYSSMLKLNPDFFVQTGDTIYYDRKEPLAKTKELARYRWNRMYALPYQREFHKRIPTYWMHDDHDILDDDCEPGDTYGELTWQDGIDLWNENIPQSEKPYRTFRWGKDLQIWLPEVRYFRSPKKMKDGPEKSILGKEQWAWLEKTMKASDATFKLYVSPTPVIGPDRKSKNDNHSNNGFSYEGNRLRQLLSSMPGTFVINGDRHWQYHSIDPETGLQEFGAGASSDAHAGGWKQEDKRPEHQFLRVKGGFLSGKVEGNKLTLTHHDVDGKVTNETVLQK